MMFQIFQKEYRFLVLVSGFLFLLLVAKSQEKEALPNTDTLYLKKGSTLIINKNKLFIDKDTVIYIPQATKYKIRPRQNEQFYQNLKNSIKNNFWVNELHNIIVIPPSGKAKTDSSKTVPSIEAYIPYHLKPIRNITIKQLTVFGPTISDTSRKARTLIEQFGNKLHIQTKHYIIKKNLLFHTGDLLNPSVISDNERLLRSLPYIEDAKIEIQPCETGNDSVDAIVIIKDVWPKAFNLKIDDVNSGRFEMWDRNILGIGHEIQNNFLWNSKKKPGVGYEGIYRINNIGNTFLNGNFTYYNGFETRIVGLNFTRNFFTPNVKYAGGLNFQDIKTETPYKTNDILELTPIKYKHFETWIGRSFLLNRRNTIFNSTKNLTLASKIKIDHFTKRPAISKNAYYLLHNKKLLLFSVTYSQQAYFKSNYIYNFGRTEDIPVGGEIAFTVGKEFNEFIDRNYAGFTISSGKYFGNAGYLQSTLTMASFFNKNVHEQGVLKTKINYFSSLFVFGRFFFRQFVNIDYTQGINRFEYEYLTINENYGIRGFKNDSVYANRRIRMSWETVCFTPWSIFDFKMVGFLFADHCWIKPNNKPLFDWHPYTGIGLGVRFRNERLVFNIIQFKFTFYPKIPSGSSTEFFGLSGESTLNVPNYNPQAPDIVSFN